MGMLQLGSDPTSKRIAIVTRCVLFATYISYALAPAWFLVFEAQTTKEYSKSVLFILGALLINAWYLTFIFQSKKYAELFDELRTIIEKSKLKMTKLK